MARLSQAQLERAVGGAAVLKQLLDKDGDGTADSALITQILDEADGEANSYISLAVDLADTTIDTAPHLLRRELDVAVYLSWLRGTMAQAMPEEVKLAYENAIRWFEAVRDRRAAIGLTTRPTSAQKIDQVLKEDTDDWFVTQGPRKRFDGWA